MEFDLVLEGGGAKGMAFVGALQEFVARGHHQGRLLGTSAGAVAAVLLAAGYDEHELLAALDEKAEGRSVFAGFLGVPGPFGEKDVQESVLRNILREADIPLLPEGLEARVDAALVGALLKLPRFRHIFSFVERGGWYTADAFGEWLTTKLNSGTFSGQPRQFGGMSLAEFYAATGVDMTVVASDTSAARLLILNHRTAPDCPVVWAVRMSMSIPLLWQEVVWQPGWGPYRGAAIDGHTVVDGGLLSSFPLALLVSTDPTVTAVMGSKRSPNVIGLLIDELLDVEGADPATASIGANGSSGTDSPVADGTARGSAPAGSPSASATSSGFDFNRLRTFQRVHRLVNTMTQAHDNAIIEEFAQLVVRVPARGYSAIDFDMSDARRDALVRAGRKAMADYLNQIETAPPSFDIAETARADAIAGRIATRILAE